MNRRYGLVLRSTAEGEEQREYVMLLTPAPRAARTERWLAVVLRQDVDDETPQHAPGMIHYVSFPAHNGWQEVE